MSRQERENLQHQAEHTRYRRQTPLTGYLVILFAVAFLLLFVAYCQQQRQSTESATNALRESNSAVDSIQALIEDNDELQAEVDELTEQVAQAQADAQAAGEQAQAQTEQQRYLTKALMDLNQLRALYNQARYSDAAQLLADLGETGQADTRQALEQAAQTLTPEQRETYDPVKAWDQLVGWLK